MGVVIVIVTLLVIVEFAPGTVKRREGVSADGKRGVAKTQFYPTTIDESAVTVVEMPRTMKKKSTIKGD